jgi:VWFA-related protein
MRLLCSLALAFLLLPIVARAQLTEKITVEVVDVPVYVYRDGVPVKGLGRDDFELFVNGRKQPFEYFDVIDDAVHGSARADEVAPVVPIRERRLFLLVFDLAFSHPGAISRAQTAALELLGNAGEGDFFSVATFSARRGLDYVVPFTVDRLQVRHAIQGLGFSAARDPLGLIVGPPPAFMLKLEPELPPEVFFMENAAASVVTGDVVRNFNRERAKRNIEHQITELASIGERLAPLKGTKHVVLLTPGFSGNTVTDMARGRGGKPPAADSRILEQLEGMYRRYQAAGVFLHTLDTEGIRIGGDALNTQSLHLLASGTGGQVISNRNDLGVALAELVSAQRTGYLLGFRPRTTRSGYNKIVVKVKDARGTSVRYRRGFSSEPVPVDVSNGIYLADIILHDVPQTGLNARIDALGKQLILRFPLQAMAAQLGGGGKADVLLYITDPHNTVVDFHQRQIEVPSLGAKVGMLTLNLDLPKGDYIAKAILRVGDAIGYSRLPFTH